MPTNKLEKDIEKAAAELNIARAKVEEKKAKLNELKERKRQQASSEAA